MKINVTQKDIKNGERWVYNRCPIALALVHSIKNIENVNVRSFALHFNIKGDCIKRIYVFSRKIQSFIRNFDTGKKVKPFSFNLEDV